ncbi:rhodanese-like domain-containing protein [Rhodococcoides yunnanense]|uniref:rhodanese-like domain-containing protein n=1 Tax=Rhodococcoides yunnanense TaxID=278209 RepID=UPI001473624F|nr:rhodanese-like domain-containing protein [Rhodococcus yunnanensis]
MSSVIHQVHSTDYPTVATTSVAALRGLLEGPSEVAVVDASEGTVFEDGHISVASPIRASETEVLLPRVLPRLSATVVFTSSDDGHDAIFAARAAQRLGYTAVSVLDGGTAAWADAGYELLTGPNALSKALGEFVERRYETPRITVDQLKSRIDSGEDIVVLDTRPEPEYRHISIPSGIGAPGAELLYRAFDSVSSPNTTVVVNCAGRTRAIIGAQALINGGFPNPVVSLENGTWAWELAGYEPARGATARAPEPTDSGRAQAAESRERLTARFGITHIDTDTLAKFRATADEHTLYLYDVRTAEEYAAGHLEGSLWGAGGQLVQATDEFVGSRKGRIVLVDGPDAVRATVTASWLLQQGLANVFVYGVPESTTLVAERSDSDALGDVATIEPAEAKNAADAGDVVIIDLEPHRPAFQNRRYIPESRVARRSTLSATIANVHASKRIVLTSGDGRIAAIAAAEIARDSVVLAGGTAAWQAAGFETRDDTDQQPLQVGEELPRPRTPEERATDLAAYVAWGDQIVDQLDRDGLVRFQAFDEVVSQ